MVKCDCGKEMSEADGCEFSHFEYGDGTVLERVKSTMTGRCGDCGAKENYYHHMGCDMERCPGCGKQAISCDCDIVSVLC